MSSTSEDAALTLDVFAEVRETVLGYALVVKIFQNGVVGDVLVSEGHAAGVMVRR